MIMLTDMTELFLWHVFFWLASALDTHESGPFRYLDEESFGYERPDSFLLHSDIKPHNSKLNPRMTTLSLLTL